MFNFIKHNSNYNKYSYFSWRYKNENIYYDWNGYLWGYVKKMLDDLVLSNKNLTKEYIPGGSNPHTPPIKKGNDAACAVSFPFYWGKTKKFISWYENSFVDLLMKI